MTSARESNRLRTLLETGIAISSELSLDAVLERIVQAAAVLTGAKYVALGVIDRSGTALERFITTGIDEQTRAAIGDLPRGRGILGVLINEAQVLRLHDLQEDPRSVGFPPNHPEMHSFLGVPILLRGVAYGNLYLTEKETGEEFNEEDEELVTLLAAQAAVAVENARLYESATQWSRQLESLNEIGNALVGELDLARLLHLVSTRLRELIGARLVAIALPTGSDLRIEAADGEGSAGLGGVLLLRPKALDDFGLTAALERLTQTFSEATGIEVQLEAALGDERFPGEVETTLYRIVQEALTNTVKHAGARKVSILIMRRGGAAAAVIEDDGRGFDPAAAREDGLGLLGMRERVELLDGKLTVESSPETGTTLVAEVPLR